MSATAARPVQARKAAVIDDTYGSGRRGRVVGYSVKIVLSDGGEVLCDHVHTSERAMVSCANKIVAEINAKAADQ